MDEALSLEQRIERKHLEHFNAKNIDDAVSLLREYMEEARIIAGGVDLVSMMNTRVIKPKVLVNIKTIPHLAYITEDAEGLKIGTLTTISEIKMAAVIRDKYTMLAEAAQLVAAPQIRNMATIGGNLCQEVRCWYYRRSPVTGRTFFCCRKGGEHCYAVAGENMYHAIFSGNECHAVSPSDLAPALIALDAKLNIASPAGERVVPLEHFYTPLGNILKPDEIITEIQLPTPRPNTKQRFLKFSLRKAIDFAISSVAAAITIESGAITDARMVLGGVAPTPYRAISTEGILKGEAITESVAEASAEAAVSKATPLSKNAYKVPITRALVKRAILW
jgi:xanthine dehydrogenase YagS FAD-binding subunit